MVLYVFILLLRDVLCMFYVGFDRFVDIVVSWFCLRGRFKHFFVHDAFVVCWCHNFAGWWKNTGPVGFWDWDSTYARCVLLNEVGMRIGFLIRALPLLLSGDLSFFKKQWCTIEIASKPSHVMTGLCMNIVCIYIYICKYIHQHQPYNL